MLVPGHLEGCADLQRLPSTRCTRVSTLHARSTAHRAAQCHRLTATAADQQQNEEFHLSIANKDGLILRLEDLRGHALVGSSLLGVRSR